MSDESCLSFSENDEVTVKNARLTGSDESYIASCSDPDTNDYKNKKAPGKIRGRRGKAKRILTPEEEDGKRLLANSQERDRMDKLNSALEALRSVLPTESYLYNRKMSKIKTLTMAKNYIAALSDMIREHDSTVGLQQTSSCLYAPRDDYSYYSSYSSTPDSSLGESRVPTYHSFESLREQGYTSSPELFNPFIYNQNYITKISPESSSFHKYSGVDYQGTFMGNNSSGTISRGNVMARPISEVSYPFNTSTPLSSRTHPYKRR